MIDKAASGLRVGFLVLTCFLTNAKKLPFLLTFLLCELTCSPG